MTSIIEIERMAYGADAIGHLPDGKTVFEQNVKANGTFRFIPSFDLPAGEYKVCVKNVVGGLEKNLGIKLK